MTLYRVTPDLTLETREVTDKGDLAARMRVLGWYPTEARARAWWERREARCKHGAGMAIQTNSAHPATTMDGG